MRQQKVGQISLSDVQRFPPHIQTQVYQQLEEQGVVLARVTKGEKAPRATRQQPSRRSGRRSKRSVFWQVYSTIPVLLAIWWVASILVH